MIKLAVPSFQRECAALIRSARSIRRMMSSSQRNAPLAIAARNLLSAGAAQLRERRESLLKLDSDRLDRKSRAALRKQMQILRNTEEEMRSIETSSRG